MKKYIAECIGTFVLTLLGCGTAVFVGCGEPAGKDACGYWIGQFLGGILAAAVLFGIIKLTGAPGAMGSPEGLGANGTANAGGALAAPVWKAISK